MKLTGNTCHNVMYYEIYGDVRDAIRLNSARTEWMNGPWLCRDYSIADQVDALMRPGIMDLFDNLIRRISSEVVK